MEKENTSSTLCGLDFLKVTFCDLYPLLESILLFIAGQLTPLKLMEKENTSSFALTIECLQDGGQYVQSKLETGLFLIVKLKKAKFLAVKWKIIDHEIAVIFKLPVLPDLPDIYTLVRLCKPNCRTKCPLELWRAFLTFLTMRTLL